MNLSIRKKIIFIIFGISFFVILIGLSTITYIVINQQRQQLINNTILQAKLIGEYSITALSFGYPERAKEVLNKLENIPSIEDGVIYDENGYMFATYSKLNDNITWPEYFGGKHHYFDGDFLHVYETILYKDKRYGTISLIAQTNIKSFIKDRILTSLLIMIILLLVSLLLANTFQKIISEPILDLANTTSDIYSKGDYTIRIRKHGNDEIGLLYDEFNHLLNEIQSREKQRDIAEEALRDSEEKYRMLAELLPQSIFELDKNYIFTFLNDAGHEYLKFSPEDIQSNINFYDIISEDYQTSLDENFKFIKENHHFKTNELEIIDNEKQKHPILAYTSPIIKHEEIEGYRGIIIDITERKDAEEEIKRLNMFLEERVKQRTEELEIAYNELKDFAYIASHDLKSPLRGIGQISQWILQDYGDAIDEKGKELLSHIIVRVKKMYALIENILQYSKIGRTDGKVREIDLNELLENLLGFITIPDEITIVFDNELPTIFADRTRIEQVFQNLIDNAVKYMDKDEGLINVGLLDDENYWKFYVKDNGPGIDIKYKDKVFAMFQSLTKSEDSTGIGLTIVKKIIEQYNGNIWFESELAKGTTFYFTITKTLNF